MVFVDRTRVAAPDVLSSEKVRAAYQDLKRFFQAKTTPDAQQQAPFNRSVYTEPAVRDALMQLFKAKCGYCETPISGTVGMDVDQLRPKQRALNADGSTSPEAYWWLAYEWANLYPTCGNCNRMKGSRFPIDGPRATAETRGAALDAEKPLLLDPCADRPDEHLVFSADGLVASNTTRGRTSIDILGLNRASLVDGRKKALEELVGELESLKRKAPKKDSLSQKRLEKLIDERLSYSAARRHVLAEWLVKEQRPIAFLKDARASAPERTTAFAHFKEAEQVQEAYSIADEGAKAHYYARTRLIDRIEIENFRAIASLTLRFTESTAESIAQQDLQGRSSTPWLMLLGENGSGKSSVLQAAAIALIGESWRNKLDLPDARRFVRKGQTAGHVHVYLTGSSTPITLTFSTASERFESDPKEPKVLLLGYGSTRLLPRGKGQSPQQYDFARIDNLFDPFEPLNDAAAWLGTLDREAFDTVARALREILQLGPNDRLLQTDGTIEAEVFGTRVSLDDLSDGYQSVVALATDIMRVMLKRWNAMEIAEGIVVLDEVGSHLHPRWRMRIVEAMRRTFPRLQFLASTHDPLCLRGLTSGEVVVMRRDAANQVVAITDLPPVAGLRVDQLLTSEYFGLNSTIDPAVDALFAEYYKLLALRQPDAVQTARLAQLKTELDGYRVLGANHRDRLMLEAIDEYIAQERAGTDTRPTPDAVKAQLVEIWRTTPAAPPGGRQGA